MAEQGRWPWKGSWRQPLRPRGAADGLGRCGHAGAVAPVRTLLRGKAGRIIRGIIAEGQSDPETIKAFLVGFVMPRRAEVRAILARGVASGELRADLDVEMVLASLFGSLQMRMLMNENVDDSWVDRLSKFVLAGCMADRGGSSRSAGPMSMDLVSASAGVI